MIQSITYNLISLMCISISIFSSCLLERNILSSSMAGVITKTFIPTYKYFKWLDKVNRFFNRWLSKIFVLFWKYIKNTKISTCLILRLVFHCSKINVWPQDCQKELKIFPHEARYMKCQLNLILVQLQLVHPKCCP